MLRSTRRFLPWLLGCLTACTCEQLQVDRIPGSVKALVCDAVGGQPGGGQKLIVESSGGTLQADTNAEGRAELNNVPPGDITIRLRHFINGAEDSRLDHVFATTLDEGATVELLDPACITFPTAPGKGGIQGQVCNRHTGQLLSGASVTVVGAGGEQHQTTTSSAGYFAFDAVTPGDHTLQVSGSGFQRNYPVHVESGQITTLQLGGNCLPFDPSTTGSIGGKLCANNGGGPWSLARASVTLMDGTVREDVSDIDGRFLIEGVPAGMYDVHVEGGGESQTLQATVTVGQTTNIEPMSDCPVPDPGTTGDVRGQLCDPSLPGQWLTGASASTTQNARLFTDNTDERGRFHLAGLAPGLVTIDVVKGAYLRQFQVPITAGATVTVADGVCAPPTWECRTEELAVEDAEPMRVMIVLDKSGSMDYSWTGTTTSRWESAVNALKDVTQRLQTEASFGLTLFPAGDAVFDSCSAGVVVVAPTTSNAGQISSALDTEVPGGGTPTAAAMYVVNNWFQTHAAEVEPVVVLATDGEPNCNPFLNPDTCDCPNEPGGCQGLAELCLDDDATVAAIAALRDTGIRTYVIGLPGITDSDVLTRMAEAGGTNAGNGRAYYLPTSTQGLIDDMTNIVQSNRTCRFELQSAPNDPAAMEVKLDGVTVPRDQARRAGWDLVGESGVELFGSACTELRAGAEHSVSVHYCTDS